MTASMPEKCEHGYHISHCEDIRTGKPRTGRRVCSIQYENENDTPGTEIGIALARMLKRFDFQQGGKYRVSVRVEVLGEDWVRKSGW